jgi:hypothetical protein
MEENKIDPDFSLLLKRKIGKHLTAGERTLWLPLPSSGE